MESIIHQALVGVLMFSVIPMVAIAFSAGIVSLVQAVTQVQEQSMVHLVRIVTLALLVRWFGEYAFHDLERLFVTVVRAGPMAVSK